MLRNYAQVTCTKGNCVSRELLIEVEQWSIKLILWGFPPYVESLCQSTVVLKPQTEVLETN